MTDEEALNEFINDLTVIKNYSPNTIESYNVDNKDWYEKPDNVVGLVLDAISGEEVTDKNRAYVYYFIKGSEDILDN